MPWGRCLGSVLQENFDFSSCSVLLSPSKGPGPAQSRTFVCSVPFAALSCPGAAGETEISQRQLQPSLRAHTAPCQIAPRAQRRRKEPVPWLLFV